MNTTIPLRTVSEANRREHWTKRSERAGCQKLIVGQHLKASCVRPALPCTIVITRVAPRKLDTDNLYGSAKHVRDAIAKWLEVDDGPDGPVTWVCEQERGKGYAIRIEVRP